MRSHGLDPKTGVYIFTGTKDDSEPEDSNDELALTTPTTTPLKRKASTKSVTFEEAPAAKKRKRASALARAEALVAKMEDGDLKVRGFWFWSCCCRVLCSRADSFDVYNYSTKPRTRRSIVLKLSGYESS